MDFDLERIMLTLPGILLALSLHEAAHAWAALKLGDSYSAERGRVTLNPLHHIDPIGFLCLLLFGFGWAKPVMINSAALKNPRRDDILISLAGPGINFLSAFITSFIIIAMDFWNVETIPVYGILILKVVYYFFTISIALGVFNLIPIPPLDGSHVLLNLLPYKYYRFAEYLNRYGWFVLIFLIAFDLLQIGFVVRIIADLFMNFAAQIFLLFF